MWLLYYVLLLEILLYCLDSSVDDIAADNVSAQMQYFYI